jgi:chromosome segregation ATPase
LHKNYQAAKNSSSKSETSTTEEELADLRSRYQNLESSYTIEVSEKKKQENKVIELETRYKNLESSYSATVETLLKKINELESLHQNPETSRNEAVKEIEERALTLESSHALVLKEKEDLHANFNELQTLYDSSKMRCNELEIKITELEAKISEQEAKIDELETKIAGLEKVSLELRNNEQDNFYSEHVEGIIKDLKQKYQDSKSENHKLHDEYEKKIRDLDTIQRESDRKCVKLREENEWIIKEKEALNAAKSNFELKYNDILTEKNKLEARFEEYKQKVFFPFYIIYYVQSSSRLCIYLL